MTSPSRSEELRAQLTLALPLALTQLGQQLMGVVDTAMLGRYSDTALAGAGIGSGLLAVVTILGMGVVMGMDTLVPQALGAGEDKRARLLLGAGLRTALLIGLPLTALAAVAPLFLLVVGVDDAVRAETWVYVMPRLPAIIPYLIITALRSYLQGASVTRPLVVAMVASNVLNVVLDGFLIFGDRALVGVGLPALGMPALGAVGASLATTLVTLVALSIFVIAIRQFHRGQSAPVDPHPGKLMASIARLGLPVGLQLFAEVGVFALTGVLAGRLGTVPAAAHMIAINIAAFVFHGIVGVGAAVSVRVGLAVGAGDHRRARRAGLVGVALGTSLMVVSALVFLFAPDRLARLFTDDPVVIAAAVPLLRIAAVFQLSDGVQAICAGALRGAGDTRATMWANLGGHYLLGLPVALTLAFGFEVGAAGLWWGLSAGLTAVAVILFCRFLWLSGRPIARSE